jgi:hypothetical protein
VSGSPHKSSWNRERAGPHNARRGSCRFCGAGHAAKLNNAISDSPICRRSRQLGRCLGAQHGAGDFPSHDTPSQKFLKKNSATRFRSHVVRLRDSSSQILQQKGDARSIQKLSCACAEIALLRSTNRRNSEEQSDAVIKRGTVMRITEYLAATILVALIVWAVLGLLMQES